MFVTMTESQIYWALGRAVARRRKELALTQADVAKQIGLTRASLANIETGRQKVLLHQVYRLVHALRLKSILDLTAAALVLDRPEQTALSFNGSEVTAEQKAQLEKFIEHAIRRASKRGRR